MLKQAKGQKIGQKGRKWDKKAQEKVYYNNKIGQKGILYCKYINKRANKAQNMAKKASTERKIGT